MLVRGGGAQRVRTGHESVGRIVAVAEGSAVEVGFGCQTADRVVGVRPGQALGVGDVGESKFGVVSEDVAGAVGGGASGEEVEVAVFVDGDPTSCVSVSKAVVLPVVGSGLGAAVRVLTLERATLNAPRDPGDVAEGVHDGDGSSGLAGRDDQSGLGLLDTLATRPVPEQGVQHVLGDDVRPVAVLALAGRHIESSPSRVGSRMSRSVPASAATKANNGHRRGRRGRGGPRRRAGSRSWRRSGPGRGLRRGALPAPTDRGHRQSARPEPWPGLRPVR